MAYFNFNADGAVDGQDLAAFRARLLTRLDPPETASTLGMTANRLTVDGGSTVRIDRPEDIPPGTTLTIVEGTLLVANAAALPTDGDLAVVGSGILVLDSGLGQAFAVSKAAAAEESGAAAPSLGAEVQPPPQPSASPGLCGSFSGPLRDLVWVDVAREGNRRDAETQSPWQAQEDATHSMEPGR